MIKATSSSCRSLEFPIECPVCKLATAESEDEEEAASGADTDQRHTFTTADRAHSQHVMSQLNSDAVDPNHAMQLHASHSTPSLDTITVIGHRPPDMAGTSRHTASRLNAGFSVSSQQTDASGKAFGANDSKILAPSIEICANTAEIGFAPVATIANAESDQPGSSQHHVSSPSFPIIVTGTPSTPSLIPTEPLAPQGSRSLFSPHQPTHGPELLTQSTEATQTPVVRLSRASLSGPRDSLVAVSSQEQADLAGRDLPLPDQMSQHSISLGSSLWTALFLFWCFPSVRGPCHHQL